MKKKSRTRLLRQQRMMGVVFLLLTVVILVMARFGVSVSETDVTPAVFTLAFGVWFLLSKRVLIK